MRLSTSLTLICFARSLRRSAASLLILSALAVASSPEGEAQVAQNSSLHTYEIGISVDARTSLSIFVDGSIVDEFVILPSSASVDWKGSFDGVTQSGNDWDYDWGSSDEEMAFVFKNGSNVEIARYIYIPYPEVYTSSSPKDFYQPEYNSFVTPDISFDVDAQGNVRATNSSSSFYETSLGTAYTIPYDLQTVQGTSNPGASGFFLARIPTGQSLASRSFSISGNATIEPSWDVDWDTPGLRVAFGGKLTVKGTLDVDGAVLKPQGSTWGGITVSNGTLTLDDAEVRDASSNGVYATGSSADVTITGESVVRGSGSNGVRASSGADVTIGGKSVITESGFVGVSARGSGTHVVIQNAFVQQGGYYATHSDMFADIDLRNTPTAAKLNANDAGVRAELAGETDTGTAGGNRIVRDPSGPSQSGGVYQDVFAMDAAYIDVSHTFWGTGVTSSNDLAITGGYEDNVVIVDPVLTTDPASGTGSVQSSSVQFTRASESGPSQSERTGRSVARSGPFVSQAGAGTAQGWVEVAERSTADESVEAIAAALDVAESEGELRMAWAAAARLAARLKTRPELQDVASSARLDALATASLQDADDAPWARRVLALSAFHGDTPDAAQPHLDALARVPSDRSASKSEEATPLSHAAFAHLMTIRAAVAAGEASRALAALTALARTDAYQASVAEPGVQAAFPESDASVARARGAAEARAQQAQYGADVTSGAGLTVGPNPSAGRVQLGLTFEVAAQLDLAIYDALGRRVRHVAQGTMEAGSHRLDADLSDLPAGVYLARLTTADHAETVRFTVTR